MRYIVIGDVHACLDELDELLKACEYRHGEETLVFLGDLIDRGPNPKGVINRVRYLGAKVIMGNHEEKALRWRKHELIRLKDCNYVNPILVASSRAREWGSFNAEEWEFLSKLPLYLRIGRHWAAVHAGVRGGLPLNGQFSNELLRLRYLRRSGKSMANIKDRILEFTHAHWSEFWTGPENIVYGHNVYEDGPHITKKRVLDREIETVGIDTGCCFGGKLTAMILDVPDDSNILPTNKFFVAVQAKKVYQKYTPPTE